MFRQAFDLLRRASQRSNVPIRELAAQIVAKTTQVPPKQVRQASSGDQLARNAQVPADADRDRERQRHQATSRYVDMPSR
jgi:hypothetical protein